LIVCMVERSAISRRELLQRGVGAALVATMPSPLACRSTRAGAPRIVVVGAGLAGLSCAYTLQRRGLGCAIYEANPERIGGRCWTLRDWDEGQVSEHGGEFIDSRHVRMRTLAERFGLELTDLYAVSNPGNSRFWLDGELRRRRAMRGERAEFVRTLERVARVVGRPTAAHHNRAAVEFDEMTVTDFLDRALGGGADSPWGRYVSGDIASEFGLDPDELSAVNLLFEYIVPAPGADERYHVKGGNDQIVAGLAASLPDGTVHMGAPLEAMARLSDGTYSLRFADVSAPVVADQVALALPFATLREVDLSKSQISARKRRCIADLGRGTNAKVAMQFDRRPQAYGHWNGYALSDDPLLETWESTLATPGRRSVITTFFGGRSGGAGLDATEPHAPTTPTEVDRNLSSLTQGGDMRLPGLAQGFNGRAYTDHWVADPWAQCSYAAFLPGQYTKYYGYAGEPEGAIHFAGEHTATTNQGYLEGAVESGERAAREILRSLRRI
jgi:monoamine oxidase